LPSLEANTVPEWGESRKFGVIAHSIGTEYNIFSEIKLRDLQTFFAEKSKFAVLLLCSTGEQKKIVCRIRCSVW
jgi:hypothetical protein